MSTEGNGFATRAQLALSALALAAPCVGGILFLYIENARMHERLQETETQLCAIGQMRNMQHLADMRTIAILWKKSFDTEYPAIGVYTPQICRRSDG